MSIIDTHGKIVSREQLKKTCDELHARDTTIVTCNGSFDLFHYGHLRFLQEASSQGEILIVGLNSDSSIKQYKDPTRPVVSQERRAEILAALAIVDFVHIFDETIPMPFLEAVRPTVHVNGAEYGEECIEAETVKNNGGEIYLVPRVAGLSTTELIQKIKNS